MAATPASMLQLVGYGLQDIERLNLKSGNPDTRYYSFVYKKRTRWASQWRRVDFDNLADFGRKATVTLPILGELITRATLVVELPDIWTPQDTAFQVSGGTVAYPFWSWANGIGHALCSSVEMAISGQVIDRLDSRLCEVIDEQRGPVEHFDSANELIGRNPSNYSDKAYLGLLPTQSKPQTVEVVYPFWWNRGPGPNALPIQALAKDKVQLTVQFRPVQDCVFTSSFVSPTKPDLPGTGPLPTFPGCPFFKEDNTQISGIAMPTEWHFTDAYWIVEYVSLEDREAAAFRNADLQIPIEQHVAVPMFPTDGGSRVRIPIKQGGLVRDMMWVAQRTETDDYNAYFLFSRDLGPPSLANQGIWWPDAQLPNWDYGDGFIRPGFSDRRSDPIAAATLLYRGKTRFEMEGPSFFRSLLPALNCRRCPLIDRYIYRYDFGFWPTGGLAETLQYHEDEVRGFANWDKLPARDLLLYMNTEGCKKPTWVSDGQPAQTFGPGSLTVLDTAFSPTTQAFAVDLFGADKTARGAYVNCIIPFQELRRIPGYQQTYVRCVPGGSTSIVVQLAGPTYIWIAVAGAAGADANGGAAGSATSIGEQGVSGTRTHATAAGGGGGGGFSVVGSHVVGAVGEHDGAQMPTNIPAFVTLLQSTGGSTNAAAGGDGYHGGGSGTVAGGGGGSYVSTYVTQVETGNKSGSLTDSRAVITPVSAQAPTPEKFNIYVWLTTYNLLRISSGRAALMFSA
jgi:hypothetical protein